jgi:hypothetical protein
MNDSRRSLWRILGHRTALFLVFLVVMQGCASSVQRSRALSSSFVKRTEARGKKTLTGRPWRVILTSIDSKANAKQEAAFTDILTFTVQKMRSENLSGSGFSESNYAVTEVSPDGSVVWETMQVNESTMEFVFFRGELRNGSMRGIVSRTLPDKTRQDFSFTAED